jgi:hypothetical protein
MGARTRPRWSAGRNAATRRASRTDEAGGTGSLGHLIEAGIRVSSCRDRARSRSRGLRRASRAPSAAAPGSRGLVTGNSCQADGGLEPPNSSLRVNPSRLTPAYRCARQRTNRLHRSGNRSDARRRAYALVASLKDPGRTPPAARHGTARAAAGMTFPGRRRERARRARFLNGTAARRPCGPALTGCPLSRCARPADPALTFRGRCPTHHTTAQHGNSQPPKGEPTRVLRPSHRPQRPRRPARPTRGSSGTREAPQCSNGDSPH